MNGWCYYRLKRSMFEKDDSATNKLKKNQLLFFVDFLFVFYPAVLRNVSSKCPGNDVYVDFNAFCPLI